MVWLRCVATAQLFFFFFSRPANPKMMRHGLCAQAAALQGTYRHILLEGRGKDNKTASPKPGSTPRTARKPPMHRFPTSAQGGYTCQSGTESAASPFSVQDTSFAQIWPHASGHVRNLAHRLGHCYSSGVVQKRTALFARNNTTASMFHSARCACWFEQRWLFFLLGTLGV